ncbi:germin-like protein subfamily T member 2 [Papaver somniferum]|uniref:germin-like protein subfamily T member 2 n=1 Tax=Papaver somniferum TaxID=3469 RepID=UPI000E6FC5AA|nr:germin-like protein subfamily T member 2 [Papaver somniferum]
MAAKSSIKTTLSFFLVLCLTVILSFTLSCFADPDELQDFCVADLNATKITMNGFPCKPLSEVTNDDFFYSGLVNEANTDNPFGVGIRPGDVTSFPALNTLELTIDVLDLAPGANVPVHTHPRGSEANLVIKGKVLFGFITTNNVLYSKVLNAGELSIIPKGLVHFVENVGPEKAVVVAVFNSQSPGASVIPFNLFGSKPAIPNDLLAKNFLVDENVIASIKSKFGN